MKRTTAFFLILLRLAIGWHFFYEGLYKLHTIRVGKTETNRPFSSAGFFREAPGPFARLVIRPQIGDPDDQAVAMLTPLPIPEGQDPAKNPLHDRMPPLLHQRWSGFVQRFADHYTLDERQRQEAETKLVQAEDNVVRWLTNPEVGNETKPVKKTFNGFTTGSVELKQTVPARVARYEAKLTEYRDALGKRNWLFRKDVGGKDLAKEKADVVALRTSLLNDLSEHQKDLEKSLRSLLTADQKELGPVVPDEAPGRVLRLLDLVTPWFLTVVGGCLLVGLFTRLSAVLAAGFLLLLYLSAPPFPWLPTLVSSPSHFAFVNEILIEMLALLVLATTLTGRWLGLDALIHACFGGLRRKPTEEAGPVPLTGARAPAMANKP